jgi:hypothetical protein
MIDEIPTPPATGDPLKNASLQREFYAASEEIMKHKGVESEETGRDLGFERALTDWIIDHRSRWLKRRQVEPRV